MMVKAAAGDGKPICESIGMSKFYGVFGQPRRAFTVRKGELVAFCGPKRGRQDTTMEMLTGYMAPSLGTARIAGHDMSTDGGGSAGSVPAGKTGRYIRCDGRSCWSFFAEAAAWTAVQERRIGAVIDCAPFGKRDLQSRSASCRRV